MFMKKKWIVFIISASLILSIVSVTNQAKGKEANLELKIVAKQSEIEQGKEIEIEFYIENAGQVPISNIVLYSKSQNYVTRIAMLQPGECYVFTRGESEKLAVTKQETGSLNVTVCAEGVAKIDGKQQKVKDEKIAKISVRK